MVASEPTLQVRQVNDQAKKTPAGSGKKEYPIKKEGTNKLKEIK